MSLFRIGGVELVLGGVSYSPSPIGVTVQTEMQSIDFNKVQQFTTRLSMSLVREDIVKGNLKLGFQTLAIIINGREEERREYRGTLTERTPIEEVWTNQYATGELVMLEFEVFDEIDSSDSTEEFVEMFL